MTGKPDDLDAVRTIAETLSGFDAAEQERIVRWALERVGLPPTAAPPITGQPVPPSPTPSPPTDVSPTPPDDRPSDIKTFIGQKRPTSDNEFAAAVAYYYRFEAPVPDRRETITASDLLEACRLAGRERPTRAAQTLVNAHHQGLLDKGGERGHYAINTVGENLVAITL